MQVVWEGKGNISGANFCAKNKKTVLYKHINVGPEMVCFQVMAR